MRNFHQAFSFAFMNFRQWNKNPRIITTFALAFVLCLLLTDKAISFAYQYGLTMQITEAFIWTFGDANSIMISSLLLILLFADMPFIHSATPFFLIRSKRSVWLWGQIIYIVLTVMLYMAFVLLSTVLISMQISFSGNMWSETGAILAYSGSGAQIAVPVSIKAMILSYPYQCASNIFFLMTFYMLFLVSFMMMINLRFKKFWGVASGFLTSVFGLLLNPQLFIQAFNLPEAVSYKANVAVGWLSPLNHATYHMHNFGYDLLPPLWTSYLIFALLISICLYGTLRNLKKYNFLFIGTTRGV